MGDNSVKVQEGVLAAIKAGNAKMTPKWRFTLKTALTITALVIVFLMLVYLVSFIIFVLHESGVWFVPDFGLSGWYALFAGLPWLLVSLSGIFIILLALLVRKYPFAYTRPLLYSLLGIAFLVIAGSFVVAGTSVARALFPYGAAESLPVIGQFYTGFGVPDLGDVHHGQVIAVTPDGFLMQDLRDRTFTVFVVTSTMLREEMPLAPGDDVVVFGGFVSTGTIDARGIEELTVAP